MDSDPAVQLNAVSVLRGDRRVLTDVSLTVRANETLAIVGRSGSGKTTLLRLVNRLLEPDSGQVVVDGRASTAWDPIALRRRTGYVVQEAGLFPHMSVAGNIATVPRLLKWSDAQISARVGELLTMVGLDPQTFRDRWPDELSGGERQRVGLARALAVDPPLLLMDEPFSALDPATRAELHGEFGRLEGARPRTILLVTHDMAEAFALADRIAVLHGGELIACDVPAAIRASSDPRVAALVNAR